MKVYLTYSNSLYNSLSFFEEYFLTKGCFAILFENTYDDTICACLYPLQLKGMISRKLILHILIGSYGSLRKLGKIWNKKRVVPDIITGLYLPVIAVMGISQSHEGIEGYPQRRDQVMHTQIHTVFEYYEKAEVYGYG